MEQQQQQYGDVPSFSGMKWNHCFYVPSFITESDTSEVDVPSHSVVDLHAYNMIIILGSTVNMIAMICHLYDHLMSTSTFTLIGAPRMMRKVTTSSIWIC